MHEQPSVLIVPSGFIVAIAGCHDAKEDGATGLRWGMMDVCKARAEACAKDVTEMIEAYDELNKGTEYKAWLGLVGKIGD